VSEIAGKRPNQGYGTYSTLWCSDATMRLALAILLSAFLASAQPLTFTVQAAPQQSVEFDVFLPAAKYRPIGRTPRDAKHKGITQLSSLAHALTIPRALWTEPASRRTNQRALACFRAHGNRNTLARNPRARPNR
jgi:hypothetical protein